MWVVVEALLPDTDHFQGFLRLCRKFFSGKVGLMNFQGFHDLLADCHDRVEGGHRVLKDHGDLFAPVFLQGILIHGKDIPAFKVDLTTDDPGRRLGQKPQDSQGGSGFPSAGLAHQAQRLALIQYQIHPVNRFHDAAVSFIVDHKILYF